MAEPSVLVYKITTFEWKCPSCKATNTMDMFTRIGKCTQCKAEHNLILRSA